MELDSLSIRELQLESARALATMDATSVNIHQFNKQAHHNSHNWYKAVMTIMVCLFIELMNVNTIIVITGIKQL